jgi:kojibiose phosphorylase
MPMFLYTTPSIAKNILKYRYDTLDGARQKAKRLGYKGAFYAWISGKTGQELCPDYFFKDVLTGRKIRNHFNDWQIHISPDITYAIDQYLQATDDWEFIENYGAEMMFEIAEFLRTRVHFKMDKDRYEVIRVLGPDEWHENVDNNIFTNFQVKYALEKTLAVYDRLAKENPVRLEQLKEKIHITEETIEAWRDIYDKIFIQPVDEDTNLIEQFDGFFDLERIMPDALAKRLINEEEYWGWPNGIAISTQVSKQADLIQLFVMHPNAYDLKVQQDNYHFYEPVCRHGSSLSPAMHAIVASRIGDIEEAYRYFFIASTIDLFNTNEAVVGGTFIGGVHTAAAGAIWQVLVYGFAGVSFEGEKILLNPGLPEEFDELSFKLHYKNNIYQLTVNNQQIIIDSDVSNDKSFTFRYDGLDYSIEPGETLVIKT